MIRSHQGPGVPRVEVGGLTAPILVLRRLLTILAASVAVAHAQPLDLRPSLSGADAALRPALDLGPARSASPPPERTTGYWVAVGVEGGVFVLGTAMAGAGLVAALDHPDGFDGLTATLAVSVGGTMAVLAGIDLVHVARGGTPALLRPPPRPGRRPVLY